MALISSIQLSRGEPDLSLFETAQVPKSEYLALSSDPQISLCPTYQIRCFKSVDDVSGDWPAAEKNGPGKLHSHASPNYHIFQTTTFLKIWEKTYATALKAELCLIEVRTENGRPVMFLPLAIFVRNGTRILSFTDQGVADYNAPVLFACGMIWTRAQAENVWQQIQKALPVFDFADLNNMPEKLGNLTNPIFLLANQSNSADSHANILSHDWDRVQQSLVRPKIIRRKLRRLHELGNCEFFISKNDAENQALLNFMLREKQQRFIETHVPGFEQYPEKIHYFNEATRVFQSAGVLHFSALKLNGEILACMWGLVSGPHYYGIMIASNLKNWAKYSPGHVLHYLLIKDLKEQGYNCLDLGVGDEDWKLQNCDLTIPLKRLTVCATLRGRLYEAHKEIMARLRATSFWQALRPLKWQLIRGVKR
ncbi:GNAT family N-acetyltransferase [Pseudochrobactrum algeriensis]|uniref:GNAT family N-acetyltransferase n=1 Tax=Pseudochrobactrum algeriensis TaxID=2834768 RepID=UPI001BCC98B2|nr:GNAT family N-acetyltransferase [Pseudochrobactrum algeriensis]MBX8812101.1 GNAT family N-acetyltransferase [Ochrobactrum sp. MR34]QVQ37358.1 GNAT family N-acetyltransferase [Pseudochrobactrum algeriensis]QVQ40577.1 GNAT family N-acetyltransferase [Pseudochrobactrum algeriensis]QVQ44499.1 GNAT family N-acetyltransferase [Pseudochrobactrum algeriensis]